jgi:hypothetical protein
MNTIPHNKMNTLEELVRSPQLGFCCLASFFAANRKVPARLLADRIGVHHSTIRSWRLRWKQHMLDCTGSKGCVLERCSVRLEPKLRMKLRGYK